MHVFYIFADLGDAISQFWIGVGSLVLSALTILVTVFAAVRSRQKKVLTYEIASNSSVVNLDRDVSSSTTVSLVLNGRPVTNVRVYVIKLFNAGNTSITPEDYPDNPSFEFTSPPYPHPLISCEVQDTGIATKLSVKQLKSMLSIDNAEQKTVTLSPPLLNPHDSLSLRVLLMADKRDSATINIRGQIKDGEIKRYASPPGFLTGRAVVIGVCIAFVLGLLISNSFGLITAFTQKTCAVGSIQISGSTSFYSTAKTEAKNYNSICPLQVSNIAVNESDSGTGLGDLENGNLQIANSELSSTDPTLSPHSYPDLVDHQVAVIIFALIVNKSVGISNLSTPQLQGIYSGQYTNWDQIPGLNLPNMTITVVGRTTISGTRESFAKYVLQEPDPGLPKHALSVDRSSQVVSAVATTKGAIGYAAMGDVGNYNGSVTTLDINSYAPTVLLIEKGYYPFWAIEHMYTSKNPDALAISFIDFVIQNLQTSDIVISLNAMTNSVLASHES